MRVLRVKFASLDLKDTARIHETNGGSGHVAAGGLPRGCFSLFWVVSLRIRQTVYLQGTQRGC